MHIIADKTMHFQILIATATYNILHNSAQGMLHHGLSGEVGLGQYTGEENPSMLKNAADSVTFCYSDMQHGIPKVGLTREK